MLPGMTMGTSADLLMPIRAEIACPCGWKAARIVQAPQDEFLWNYVWQQVHDAIREDGCNHMESYTCPFWQSVHSKNTDVKGTS